MRRPADHESARHLLEVPVSRLTEDDKIRKLRFTFHELIVGEIVRMLDEEVQAAPIGVGSMILSLCAIDFLGTLLNGSNAEYDTFTTFTSQYLKAYNPDKLWKLRNNLVHNYVRPPGAYVFTAGSESRTDHLQPIQADGEECIIVDNLIEDIAGAGEQLFQEALSGSNQTVRKNVLKRAAKKGIINLGES